MTVDPSSRAREVHSVLTDMYLGEEQALAERLLKATSALREVLRVHAPYAHGDEGTTYVGCAECGDYDNPSSLDYPCGTVTVIAETYGLTALPNSVLFGEEVAT